jgi:hypothetical protein
MSVEEQFEPIAVEVQIDPNACRNSVVANRERLERQRRSIAAAEDRMARERRLAAIRLPEPQRAEVDRVSVVEAYVREYRADVRLLVEAQAALDERLSQIEADVDALIDRVTAPPPRWRPWWRWWRRS